MNWRVRARTSVGALALDVDLGGNVEPVALVGPNGSGKTTLLRVITGALRPESGTITVGERVLFSSNDSVDVPIEDRRVGYVPQGHRLFPHLGVEDNVAFGLTGTRPRPSRSECRARALDMLAKLGCSNLAARSPHRLSGGERQRVALARALVIEPQILLLDEPLSAMDASARRRLRTFLGHHLAALVRPALVVTHDVRDVTAIGATVVVLESGRVVQRGTVDDLRAAPATDFVAEFVGA